MSVNCIYKSKGSLRAHNTDGLGFYESLKILKVNKDLNNIVLIGLGGYKPVLVYLKKYFQRKLYCFVQTEETNPIT